MSNYLADALGKKSDELLRTIAELENSSGNPSEDVRLASTLITKNRQKISELGLDPNDTTAEELYGALNTSFAQKQEAFLRSVGGQPSSENIADLFSHFETQGVWTPKPSFIKKALIEHPPKKLMKALHYRTAESMMKRENPTKIAAAAGVCESSSWISAFEKQINRVASSDWQIGPINILLFENAPWSELPGKKTVQISCIAGSVILRPNLSADSDTFCLALRTIQAIETLTAQSQAAALKMLGEPQNYHMDTASQVPKVKIGGLSLSLSEYKMSSDDVAEENAENERREMPISDLWQQFFRIHPALSWWKDSENLVFVDDSGEAVSLNLADVAKNATNNVKYSRRNLENGRRKLEDVLASKYAAYETFDTPVSQRTPSISSSPQEKLRQLQVRYGASYSVGVAS